MYITWTKYLCDPVDKSSLSIDKIIEKKGDEIITGVLKSRSGHIYRIVEGVPVLLNRYTQSTKSVDSFAYEWENFDFDYGKKGWLSDVVRPVLGNVKYFKNKTIIDCGAGSGRQSLWIAEAGAKFVFSIELSDSARTMVKNVVKKYKRKVFVIQADIANLPINRKTVNIDSVYCVNVIQHTKSPIKTLKEISSLIRKGPELIFNIYLRRGNTFLIDLVEILKKMHSRLPKVLIRINSFLMTLVLYPIISKHRSFKELWLDIYDLLGTHSYQKFYTEKYLIRMLKILKLKIVRRSYYAMILKK